MKRVLEIGRDLLREEDGIAVTEYGILIGVVAVFLIGMLVTFRNQLQTWFTRVTGQLTAT
ncbi:MAG: Flp family type IVb pilin [Gemmatimonadaceae bacterium]